MTRDMEAVALLILADEGGVADLNDGKGLTKWGQTPDWLQQWNLPEPESAHDALRNYGRWMEHSRLCYFADKDQALGYVVITFAVHAGESLAIKAAQSALGVATDGLVGPQTRMALQVCDPSLMAHQVLATYTRYLGKLLGSKNVDRRVWARGWNNRIAKLIEAIA